jgi:hypothetical protein
MFVFNIAYKICQDKKNMLRQDIFSIIGAYHVLDDRRYAYMVIKIMGKELEVEQKDGVNKFQVALTVTKLLCFSALLEVVFSAFGGVNLYKMIFEGIGMCIYRIFTYKIGGF